MVQPRTTSWVTLTELFNPGDQIFHLEEAQTMRDKYRNGSLVTLNAADCINAYSQAYISIYGNVLLIYGNGVGNRSLLWQDSIDGRSRIVTWLCGGFAKSCDPKTLSQENATHWDPFKGFNFRYQEWDQEWDQDDDDGVYLQGHVKYCIAEEHDHPGMSPPILVTVLVCNAIKTVCFTLVLWIVGSSCPLVTNGDVVESFLLRPDPKFQGRCLVSRLTIKRRSGFWSTQLLLLQWLGVRRRWAAGASKNFWLGTFIPYVWPTDWDYHCCLTRW